MDRAAILPAWAVLALAACACAPSCALDLARPPALPAPVTDGVLQVGARRVILPAGDWVLTAVNTEETIGRGRRGPRYGQGISAWAVLVEGGTLRAIVWLGLPLEDFAREHRARGNGCTDDDSIERVDLSAAPTQPECLGVYGHRDLAAPLGARTPRTLAWLQARGAADPGAVVRFVYKRRSDDSYGGVSLILPATPFGADEEASRWSRGLRDACRPLFEGRAAEARLPPIPPPAAPASAAAPVGSSNP